MLWEELPLVEQENFERFDSLLRAGNWEVTELGKMFRSGMDTSPQGMASFVGEHAMLHIELDLKSRVVKLYIKTEFQYSLIIAYAGSVAPVLNHLIEHQYTLNDEIIKEFLDPIIELSDEVYAIDDEGGAFKLEVQK